MAEGYARVTGRVGGCEGPSGGGATYILPGLAEANESSIAVLGINTDISVGSRGRYTLTELDQRTLMRPVTKWNAVLDRAADIPRVFRQAFEMMTSGRPGAAHIALPFDVQSAPVNATDVWADPSLGVYPSRRVAPDPEMVALAAKLLRGAKAPVFVCGGGVVISHAEAELTELAEKLAAPVATTISGKGAIDERCAHAVGVVGSNGGTPETRAIVDAADVIVFVGCPAGSVTTEHWRHPPPGQAPLRPERVVAELSRQLDPDATLVADPGTPCPYFSAYYVLRGTGRFFSNRAHGALGYALAAAVGAHFGRPHVKTVAVMGDGSFGMCAGELETLVRLKLPITAVVISNATYGWIKAGQRAAYGQRYFGVDFSATDHAAVARAYGLRAWRVTQPRELAPALQAALAAGEPTPGDIVCPPLP